MRLFISSLSSIWIKNQIFAKKYHVFTRKSNWLQIVNTWFVIFVNHDYNNYYYSFEEVGVTCLFGIVCLLISPHDGTTVLPLVAIPCGTGITKYIISGCWSWILAKSDPETNFAPGKRLISLYKVEFGTSGGDFLNFSSSWSKFSLEISVGILSRDISGLSFWALEGSSCSIHSGIGSALTVTISSFSSITRIFLSRGSSSSESYFWVIRELHL